ncbi:hypothetical protein B0T16DRAFT_410524 [Cercophora newfieldiana]|uniref:Uncharacterized protein n=1 Tax=Cercophora newfieldiana TaxID=92897 RepID=A0AA39YDS3_9PEZI|nr:hypothetical protein B0T16DRAFT_410524 [Cercophora newfieldiana]
MTLLHLLDSCLLNASHVPSTSNLTCAARTPTNYQRALSKTTQPEHRNRSVDKRHPPSR